MAASPSKEDLAAFHEALAAAYAALDELKTAADFALDDVQTARDAARSLFGTPEATSIFGNPIADIHLAHRAITDAIDGLPPVDEGDVSEA